MKREHLITDNSKGYYRDVNLNNKRTAVRLIALICIVIAVVVLNSQAKKLKLE